MPFVLLRPATQHNCPELVRMATIAMIMPGNRRFRELVMDQCAGLDVVLNIQWNLGKAIRKVSR